MGAESTGFEPVIQLPVYLISNQAQSASLATFLLFYFKNLFFQKNGLIGF